jgi:hypothetical protein
MTRFRRFGEFIVAFAADFPLRAGISRLRSSKERSSRSAQSETGMPDVLIARRTRLPLCSEEKPLTVQNPVRLNIYNEPQPDLVLAKPRADYYASNHPTGEDVFLVLEVADTTLRKDRNVKLPIYARLEVPEVWIEDLAHDLILVFRDRAAKSYKTGLTMRRGDTLSVAAFPEITFKVENLLG